jgi:hypothetical protein
LTPGTSYSFAVAAINIVGVSPLSAVTILMAATVPGPPSIPSLLLQSSA